MSNQRGFEYRSIRFGVETLEPGLVLERHHHRAGYATVVLAGTFEEAGFAGRYIVRPGDVLLHGAFDCHANRPASPCSFTILRLPWRDNALEGRFRVADPDNLAVLAGRNPEAATLELRQALIPCPPEEPHWTERLRRDLCRDQSVRLNHWAEGENLTPESVSRGFYRAFGVTPKRFALETRARQAWNRIRGATSGLTEIAFDFGFADLSHLSRAVRGLTGAPPSVWLSSRGSPRQIRSS